MQYAVQPRVFAGDFLAATNMLHYGSNRNFVGEAGSAVAILIMFPAFRALIFHERFDEIIDHHKEFWAVTVLAVQIGKVIIIYWFSVYRETQTVVTSMDEES